MKVTPREGYADRTDLETEPLPGLPLMRLQDPSISFHTILMFINLSLHLPEANVVKTTLSAFSTPDVMKTVSTAGSKQSFDSFDYNSHWYPVTWARDVPLNQPTRVTLFDVDYVLARTTNGDGDEALYAMLDVCPHKKVALSEGRITECGERRHFQCSLHGEYRSGIEWPYDVMVGMFTDTCLSFHLIIVRSNPANQLPTGRTFDGESGECIKIPQTLITQKNSRSPPAAIPKVKRSVRRLEDATAVAIRIEQGMVWIAPAYTPLEALAATETGKLLLPARVPEMDLEGYTVQTVFRDFPIDWTVLIEHALDVDHGYFAHSGLGTISKGFE